MVRSRQFKGKPGDVMMKTRGEWCGRPWRFMMEALGPCIYSKLRCARWRSETIAHCDGGTGKRGGRRRSLVSGSVE